MKKPFLIFFEINQSKVGVLPTLKPGESTQDLFNGFIGVFLCHFVWLIRDFDVYLISPLFLILTHYVRTKGHLVAKLMGKFRTSKKFAESWISLAVDITGGNLCYLL